MLYTYRREGFNDEGIWVRGRGRRLGTGNGKEKGKKRWELKWITKKNRKGERSKWDGKRKRKIDGKMKKKGRKWEEKK